ncbi:MAG: DUF6265 family protein [Vicinamibacterales bacterium]
MPPTRAGATMLATVLLVLVSILLPVFAHGIGAVALDSRGVGPRGVGPVPEPDAPSSGRGQARAGTPAAPTPARAGIDVLAWLAGTWTSVPGGPVTEERWTEPGGGAMLGTSRTIAGGRLVAFEYLRVVERDGGLVYVAQPGGRPPTEFVLTRADGTHAVFENPAHDYPQVISYTLGPDGELVARISDRDGGRAQAFRFRRSGVRS